MPIAPPICAGRDERCSAICRPDSAGPIPRPISAHEEQALPVGRGRVEVAKPSAPSAASPAPTSTAAELEPPRETMPATLTETSRPSSSG